MDEIFEVEFEDVTIVEPVIEPLSITENGRYEAGGIVDGYSPIDVDVQPTIEELNITENGVYNAPEGVHGFNPVTVDVQPPLEQLNATFNGEYLPSENTYGFSKVTVDVPISGQAEFKDVNFIDYDGTLLYSYTANEFLALTEMPPNPEHDRLIAQGWNWDLEDAKEVVTRDGWIDIGQLYDTKSGATEVDIELLGEALSPYVGFKLTGTATIDWGDGSEPSELSSSYSSIQHAQHTYQSAGRYTIKIFAGVNSSIEICGTTSGQRLTYLLNSNSSQSLRCYEYVTSIKQVFVHSSARLYDGAFSACRNLQAVTLPITLTTSGGYLFYRDETLKFVVMPKDYDGYSSSYVFNYSSFERISFSKKFIENRGALGRDLFSYNQVIRRLPSTRKYCMDNYIFESCVSLTHLNFDINEVSPSIGNSVFSGCYSLQSVIIPSSCITILPNAFYNCCSLTMLKFKSNNPPTLSNSTVFYGLPTDCKIYVPRGSLEAYTTATNYPSSATYQYIEY